MNDKLKTMIQVYAHTHQLDERFSWDFALDSLPSTVVRLLPNSNAFQKNVVLKNCLRRHLKCSDYPMEYWIIQTWGGIQRFKKNEKMIKELRNYMID